MLDTRDESISTMIWTGDVRGIELARQSYNQDKKKQLIPFAVALYSFRFKRMYAKELVLMYPLLYSAGLEFVDESRSFDYVPVDTGKVAHRGDVLSTHLEWLSRRSELSYIDRRNCGTLAYQIANASFPYADDVHTSELLRLTQVRIHVTSKRYEAALRILHAVAHESSGVQEVNQRARIYMKLGFLYDKCGHAGTGFLWSWRALTMRGIPLAVRIKALAAMLGIER